MTNVPTFIYPNYTFSGGEQYGSVLPIYGQTKGGIEYIGKPGAFGPDTLSPGRNTIQSVHII